MKFICLILMQVCSTDLDQFSINNLADATTATNAKSAVGTSCLLNAAGTDFSGDYIEIDGQYEFKLILKN